jgi:hypothetical protein
MSPIFLPFGYDLSFVVVHSWEVFHVDPEQASFAGCQHFLCSFLGGLAGLGNGLLE